jgi:uncharacterized phage protein (TIGR01671 family)
MTNRETIKFRVWTKKYKRWLSADDGGTHASSNWMLDIFTGKIVDYVNCNGEYIPSPEPDHYFDGLTHINESPLVIQQCTGLKDKNGIDIYEGDILEIFNHSHHEEVEYEPGGSGFGFFAYDSANRDCGAFQFLSDWTTSEGYMIVGNIFENSELLKA